MTNRILEALKHPNLALEWFLLKTHLLYGLGDESYLKVMWFIKTGKRLNLKNPVTYNEKLQWLKLYDRTPVYTTIVDKITAKEYVAGIIGPEYIIPTLKVWDSCADISLDGLPDKFVLKTNNGSSSDGVVICKDKRSFNLEHAKSKLMSLPGLDLYKATREWPYKDIVPKVFAEQYLEDETGELRDYKFFCFDGEVKALFIATDRFGDDVKFDFFDADFNHIDMYQVHKMSGKQISKPEGFEEMKAIASRLSKGFPHVRVDLYNVNGVIYFGEMTFFHHGGFAPFHPEEWNRTFGEWIKLPVNEK